MKKYFKTLIAFLMMAFPAISFAREGASSKSSEASQPAAIIMFTIMLLLIFVIIVLSNIVFTTYDFHKEKLKKLAKNAVPFLVFGLLIISLPSQAQDAPAAVQSGPKLIGGLSQTSFYLMASAIILELIIVAFLVRTFLLFSGLKKEKKTGPVEVKEKKKFFAWLEKLNNTKSVDAASEARVNLGHDYDGIGELDNPTPPWWQWGFVLSVVFAGFYLYTHHVSHSAPTQFQELAMANEKAEEQQKAYLASSANKIDENSVTYLSDAADLAEGKSIFTAVCAACHRADGGGIVGPNLTDDYWLHGGSIKDIFKTIKYGVPEKGMKSWKDDYSPKKIEQLASYIHSIKGSNPPSPKEPQGEKYTEEAEPLAK